MSAWGWIGTIAAIWFVVSVIVAVGWGVVKADIKRSPRPVPDNSHLSVVPDSEEREA